MNPPALAQRILSWRLFSRRVHATGPLGIIAWWELRRIPYNLAVGIAGLGTLVVTMTVAAIASEAFGEPLSLPDPPIVAVFAVIAYGIGANVCYTGGWIIEIIARKLWGERVGAFAEIGFTLGLAFSILLTLTPAFLFTGVLILRLALG